MRFGWILLLSAGLACAQTAPKPESGKRYGRVVIRNAMVIEGNGAPVSGPMDIAIVNGTITDVVPARGRRIPAGDAEIDAAGKYVMPGLINVHAHVQDERAGIPQPLDYELKIWLACGITSVRDVGSDMKKTLQLRADSAAGKVASPRIFVYPMFNNAPTPKNAEEARAKVRQFKAAGVDGIKIVGTYRDVMEGLLEEAHKAGLPVAHHGGVGETTAWDDIRLGTTSIEHWYGIPDAAIDGGVQNFPASYNYLDEADRFRYAGHLWREANPKRLLDVLDGMIKASVAWVPTLDIYEASRDLQRAQTQPIFKDYLHPTLEKYFEPNLANHGSYFVNWTTTDEVFWRENYRIEMDALKEFGKRGGLIGCGDDAGFIYQMYGIGLIREMELHQEAGFHPLKVVQHCTENNARILGQQMKLGRVRAGWAGDVIVVNGNPLEDFKVLYPKIGPTGGGVEWTVKDGIPYHGPTLMKDVKDMVAKARAK